MSPGWAAVTAVYLAIAGFLNLGIIWIRVREQPDTLRRDGWLFHCIFATVVALAWPLCLAYYVLVDRHRYSSQ